MKVLNYVTFVHIPKSLPAGDETGAALLRVAARDKVMARTWKCILLNDWMS
jgi:hypothetical protein